MLPMLAKRILKPKQYAQLRVSLHIQGRYKKYNTNAQYTLLKREHTVEENHH